MTRCFGELAPRNATAPGSAASGYDAHARTEEVEDLEWGEDAYFSEGGRVPRMHISFERVRTLVQVARTTRHSLNAGRDAQTARSEAAAGGIRSTYA